MHSCSDTDTDPKIRGHFVCLKIPEVIKLYMQAL